MTTNAPILPRIFAALSALSLCTACTVEEYEAPEDTSVLASPSVTSNGFSTNGFSTNGFSTNGFSTNGFSTNGPDSDLIYFSLDTDTVSNISLNGSPIKATWIDDGNIYVKLMNGSVVSGQSIVGLKVNGKIEDGTVVTLKVTGAEKFKSIGGTDLYRYTIAFTWPGGPWAYVCGKQNGTPIKTIPVPGSWNYAEGVPDGGSKLQDNDRITFACQNYALYKCVDLGYNPWLTKKGKSLEDHHQACVRMIRADYCGDGQPWTVDGTIINVYDNLGIQKDVSNWDIEAEWNEHGARCLSHQRIQDMPEVPQCEFDRTPAQCGNPPSWKKTLLVSEAQ
jgi:hypothetical protein